MMSQPSFKEDKPEPAKRKSVKKSKERKKSQWVVTDLKSEKEKSPK